MAGLGSLLVRVLVLAAATEAVFDSLSPPTHRDHLAQRVPVHLPGAAALALNHTTDVRNRRGNEDHETPNYEERGRQVVSRKLRPGDHQQDQPGVGDEEAMQPFYCRDD